LDSIISRICDSNGFEKSEFKIHVIKNDDINAFALPNQHLVIFTGLLLDSENESELAGVICHEIAHMRSNHVMKKLIKEIGLSALISISTGNSGSEIVKETARLLSSSAYDRKLEKEADMKAADYMINSEISPEYFADFLLRLSERESQIESHLSWISTHPESRERAEYILEYRKGEPKVKKEIISQVSWEILKSKIKEL
jgi:predicted Zn-dependent protease